LQSVSFDVVVEDVSFHATLSRPAAITSRVDSLAVAGGDIVTQDDSILRRSDAASGMIDNEATETFDTEPRATVIDARRLANNNLAKTDKICMSNAGPPR